MGAGWEVMLLGRKGIPALGPGYGRIELPSLGKSCRSRLSPPLS